MKVDEYYRQWQPLIEGHNSFASPFMQDEVVDAIHLPSHLNLPLLFSFMLIVSESIKPALKNLKPFGVWRHWWKNVGSLIPIRFLPCRNGWKVMIRLLWWHIGEFIDLRTYVFQHGQSEYTRTRFYMNGDFKC